MLTVPVFVVHHPQPHHPPQPHHQPDDSVLITSQVLCTAVPIAHNEDTGVT
ncbi:MAG: hypothetical protein WCI00_02565 [bacterium]